MPVAGIICLADGSYQDCDTCLHRHENYLCQCDALPLAIKMVRDNHKGRANAGISVSTLIGCPRSQALLDTYDYYMPLEKAWTMGQGTAMHKVLEDDDDPPWIVKERRAVRYIEFEGEQVRLSGQIDRIDTKYKRLIDWKSTRKPPFKPSESHAFQSAFYRWLIKDCILLADAERNLPEEPFRIDIVGGGMHYITNDAKKPFTKIAYPLWEDEEIERVIRERLKPIMDWKKHKIMPACSPYTTYGKNWKCDCVQIQEQLEERGEWNG